MNLLLIWNLAIALIAIFYAVFVSVKHMHVLEAGKRTPLSDFYLLSLGVMAWAIFGMMALSAIVDYPEWVYDDAWTGNWGYTTARTLMLCFWVGVLHKWATKCKKFDELCNLCNQYRVRKK